MHRRPLQPTPPHREPNQGEGAGAGAATAGSEQDRSASVNKRAAGGSGSDAMHAIGGTSRRGSTGGCGCSDRLFGMYRQADAVYNPSIRRVCVMRAPPRASASVLREEGAEARARRAGEKRLGKLRSGETCGAKTLSQ